MSAWWALVFHTFCPLTIQSSPSRTAVACRPARSDPAPGSLNSWHHVRAPVRVDRRYRRLSSSLPWSWIVGAASQNPAPSGAATPPACRIAECATRSAQTGSRRPNQSADQDGTAQPESTSRSRHVSSGMSGSHAPWNHSSTSSATSASVISAIPWTSAADPAPRSAVGRIGTHCFPTTPSSRPSATGSAGSWRRDRRAHPSTAPSPHLLKNSSPSTSPTGSNPAVRATPSEAVLSGWINRVGRSGGSRPARWRHSSRRARLA